MRSLWLEDGISVRTSKEKYKLMPLKLFLDTTIKASQVFMILY